MRGLSRLLLAAGLVLGGAVALAMVAHIGLPGASWLLNVAVAKLTLIGAGGLLAGGAITGRLAKRQEQRELAAPPPHDETLR